MMDLNNATDEELENIRYFAGLLYSDEELAIILEVEPVVVKSLMREPNHPVRRVILQERYKQESAIRQVQLRMAKHGSSQSIDDCNKMLRRIKR